MKKLTFLMTLILFVGCTPIVYTPVSTDEVNIQGTKNELYVKANLWMVDQFSNAKSVIQFSDKEAGVFISGFTMFPDTNTKHYIFFIVTGIFEFILGYIWIKRWINENMGETA